MVNAFMCGSAALILMLHLGSSASVSPAPDVKGIHDLLSQPRPHCTSHTCVATPDHDDRLVNILRHHSFLRELQAVAAEGANERSRPDHVTLLTEEAADQRSTPEETRGEGDEGRARGGDDPDLSEFSRAAAAEPEEASGSRNTDDTQGLAAIESDLQRVAQKLHQMRRG